MKLLLHRSHRPGLLGGRIIYRLDVRADLTEDERADIATYGLGGTQLYQRLEVAERGRGLLGMMFRLRFKAANLTLSVRDLIEGKRVECADIVEMLALEDQVRQAARTFSLVLNTAARFDGDEVLDV